MAFPVVESLTATAFTATATSHLVAMPATVNSGDLLIAKFVNQVDAVTTPSGWTNLHTTASTVRLGTYYKPADGTEGGTTVDFVTSSPRRGVAHVYRISGWHGTTPPEVGTAATGNSTTPNPPTLTPSWGAEDTLWLAGCGVGAIVTASVYPTSYTNGTDDDATTTAPSLASARRELNATSDDPGTFTVSASAVWVAQTVAIRTAAGGGATTVTPAVDAVTTTLPTPAILAAATLAPAVIPIVASLPTPLIAAAAKVTPAAIAVVATLLTPTISVGAVAVPAVIAVTTTLPTPSVLAAAKVTPAVIPVTVTLPTPTINVAGGPVVATPAVIPVVVSLPTPTVLAASKVLPAVIPLTVTLPTPTIVVASSATVLPATIAVLAGLPTPTIAAASVVTPAGITVVMTLPIPDVSTPGVVTPAGISLVVVLPTPNTIVGAMTFWTPNPVAFVRVGPDDEPPWN